jgi:hypothetical protein
MTGVRAARTAFDDDAASSRRLGRSEIVAMGRSESPWRFVPIALQALTIAPHDDEVRFLLACAYAKLGLRTCAIEAISQMSDQARATTSVMHVHEHIAKLPHDGVSAATVESRARQSLRALAGRVECDGRLDHELEAWCASLAELQYFATLEGDVVVKRAGAWVVWHDQPQLERAHANFLDKARGHGLVIDGVHAPRVIRSAVERTSRTPEGFETPITLMCGSVWELLIGLSLAEHAPLLADSRVVCIAAKDAPERLLQRLLSHFDHELPWPVVISTPSPGGIRWDESAVPDLLEGVKGTQQRVFEQAKRELDAAYSVRDEAWYVSRIAGARAGTQAPLRVLILTTRYGTFVPHSSQDLADALVVAGCEVRVHIEPDDMCRLVTMSYARVVAEFMPDLVVVINRPRAGMDRMMPMQVPFVCWVQDAMPYLFDPALGGTQGRMDFVMGHLMPELFQAFGYKSDRFRATPVVACTRKFHRTPARASRSQRDDCEIAYISHHAATPQQLRDKLIANALKQPGNAMPRIIEALYPGIVRTASRGVADGVIDDDLRVACRGAIEAVTGATPSEQVFSEVLQGVARPIGERVLRHQMVAWAARIAQRRGWRMRLYGRGWEQHADYAQFARGELSHGDHLRSVYQSSRASLHASLGFYTHQRVLETALSGGLPLVRLKADDVHVLWHAIELRRSMTQEPAFTFLPDRSAYFFAADDDESMMATCQLETWLRCSGSLRYRESMRASSIDQLSFRELPSRDARWLMGDLRETCFDSEAQLEALLLRAVERPAWRENISKGIAARAARSLSYDVMARRMLDFVQQGLVTGAVPQGVAA